MDFSNLLTTEEVAVQLKLAPFTLRNWRVKGTGPTFVLCGRLPRYRQSDVDAWVESRIRLSTSDTGAGK
jgi:hypothetical protein